MGKQSGNDRGVPNQAVVTIAAIAAGFVAQRLVGVGWKFVRGKEPGKDESPLPELLVFAAVSAATVAVAKNWATHRAAKRFSS
jgi:hypothetical protein